MNWLARLFRLPVDILLLSFHWLIGTIWLIGNSLSRLLGIGQFGMSPFTITNVHDESGAMRCGPGALYGNPFLFGLLCPDLIVGPNRCCRCAARMFSECDRWKPSWLRILGLGALLTGFWGFVLLYSFRAVEPHLPQRLRHLFGTAPATERISRLKEQLTDEQRRSAAIDFVNDARDEYARGNLYGAMLQYRNAIKNDPANADAHFGYGLCLYDQELRASAEAELREAITLNPRLWQAHAKIGRLMVYRGQYSEATAAADAALQANPNATEAYLIKGLALHDRGEDEQARTLLRRVDQFLFDNAEDNLLAGTLLYALGQYEPAERCYTKALKLDPKEVKARVGLAYLYSAKGDDQAAMEQLRLILANDEKNIQALLCKAELMVAKNDLRHAIQQYEELIKLAPLEYEFRNRLAELYWQIGRPQQAFEKAEEVITDRPDEVRANTMMAAFYLSSRLPFLAKRYVETVLKQDPKHVGARSILAKTYMAESKFEQAIPELLHLLAERPADPELHLMLGHAYENVAQMEKALQAYRQAAERMPTSARPLVLIGQIYQRDGDSSAAIAAYETALQRVQDAPLAMNNLAIVLLESGQDPERAYQLAVDVQRRFPNNPQFMDSLGWMLYHREQWHQAEDWFATAAARSPDNPVFHYHLGLAYRRQDMVPEAIASLQTALSIYEEAGSDLDPAVDEVRETLTEVETYFLSRKKAQEAQERRIGVQNPQ